MPALLLMLVMAGRVWDEHGILGRKKGAVGKLGLTNPDPNFRTNSLQKPARVRAGFLRSQKRDVGELLGGFRFVGSANTGLGWGLERPSTRCNCGFRKP